MIVAAPTPEEGRQGASSRGVGSGVGEGSRGLDGSGPAAGSPGPCSPGLCSPGPCLHEPSSPEPCSPGPCSHEASSSGEDDELFLVGERIADLAAGINAAEGKMMTLLADFDRRGGWKDGFSSCADWLAWRTGTKIGPARERVRAARALENLPQTAAALQAGRLSYAKVRAITRVATPESEGALLEFARAGSAARLEQMVRLWKQLSREGELTAEQARHRSRAFSVFVDGDGMYVVKGRLEPEVGAMLMRAVEAAADALYRREKDAEEKSAGEKVGEDSPKPKQRRADAVGLVAERALAAGFGEEASEEGAPGESGTRAERYQVIVHADAATLTEEGEPGRSDLDGIRVSAETSRRMACDAATVTMFHGEGGSGASRSMPSGSVLSVGRKTRTIPPHYSRSARCHNVS